MKEFMKSHWDVGAVIGAATLSKILQQWSLIASDLILTGTLIFVGCKAFIWLLKARVSWRNRNNTQFWQRKQDEEETET